MLKAVGRTSESRRILRETVAQAGRFVDAGDESPTPRFEAAAATALMGRLAEARIWFRRAVDAGWRDVRWARRDPVLAAVRGDGVFRKVLEDVGDRLDAERRMVLELIHR